jgi:tetratricopeptide (TPR) repeat protein
MRCVVGLLACARAALAEPVPAPAQTQAQAGTPAEAATAFDDGRKLLAQHRPSEACAKFARALEIEPGNVGVLLNLGLCNEQLDKLATALTWFRRARASASERALAESLRAAGDKIAALSRTVPTLRISLSPPAGAHVNAAARIAIDGAAVATSELARVELDAGHHVVEFTAAGSTGSRTEVDLVDGAATPLALVVPAPRAEPPVVRPAVPPPRPEAAPAASDAPVRRRQAYIAGGIGAGLVLGSVALGLVGRSAAHGTDHPDAQRDWKSAVRYGGTSMFVLGSAALGWAAWTLLHAPAASGPERPDRADRAAGPVVAPVVGAGSIGVGVHGAF